MDELIISVAPCPGEKQEERFPGRINVANEIIQSYNAGASIAHLHVRDEQGLQVTDTRWFERDLKRIQDACSIIIEGSTGGAPEHALSDRCSAFTVPGVEMGSLNLGSINMYDGVYSNSINDIAYYAQELKKRNLKPILVVFDLSNFGAFELLEGEDLASPPHVVSLVFDVPNALRYKERFFDTLYRELPKNCVWFMTRHHAPGAPGFKKALELGGHIRVGYEDGPFLASGKRARNNAELVEDVVNYAKSLGRTVVSPDRARQIMGLTPDPAEGTPQ